MSELLTDRSFAVPLLWKPSILKSFVEVPVVGARFISVELQLVDQNGLIGGAVLLSTYAGVLEIYLEDHLADIDEDAIRSDASYSHRDTSVFRIQFESFKCDVTEGAVTGRAVFRDAAGDRIEVAVSFAGGKSTDPIFVPAPLQERPSTLRFFLANEFRLLSTRRSSISVRVNGLDKPARPFGMPWRRIAPVLEARCGTGFVLGGLSSPDTRSVLPVVGTGITILNDGVSIEASDRGVSSISIRNLHGWFNAEFNPPVPQPSSVKYQAGRVAVTCAAGRVAQGSWLLRSTAEVSVFQLLNLQQDWRPGYRSPERWALRYLRRIKRRGRRWHYRAVLRENGNGEWLSRGYWSIEPRVRSIRSKTAQAGAQ